MEAKGTRKGFFYELGVFGCMARKSDDGLGLNLLADLGSGKGDTVSRKIVQSFPKEMVELRLTRRIYLALTISK